MVEADGRSSSTRERIMYREVSEVSIRETSITEAIRNFCFVPVNGSQYLEFSRFVAGFLAIRIVFLFKRMEQRKHDDIIQMMMITPNVSNFLKGIDTFFLPQFKESVISEKKILEFQS